MSCLVRRQIRDDFPENVLSLVSNVCDIAGSRTLIDDARVELAAAGVIEAVRRHNDGIIFEWLMNAVSFQGIADIVAETYIEQHERVSASDIEQALAKKPSCPKLQGYHRFYGCNYRKWQDQCTELKHKPRCPLPKHDLRNGRLNQTAYSLYMFIRDVADGDFVSWVDYQLRPSTLRSLGPQTHFTGPVVGPLAHVYGISDKVLNMSLASLLLAGDIDRTEWIKAGAEMIAIDSLVHNWLHRSGILKAMKAGHEYGAECYKEGGCAELLSDISRHIDARKYNRSYPSYFPRFVQFAIWRFCGQSELNICNGNKVSDRARCKLIECPLHANCGRIRLHKPLLKSQS